MSLSASCRTHIQGPEDIGIDLDGAGAMPYFLPKSNVTSTMGRAEKYVVTRHMRLPLV